MPFQRRVQETLNVLGPAFLVSVAYLDPGNWATAIEGGSRFGYQLIWVVVVSNLIAILLQNLAARLGIVTGKHLAEVCREQYPFCVCLFLWCLSEISIIALDLTMVLGTAVGINLLFGIPMMSGILLTSLDFVVILFMVPKVARVRFVEFLTVCIIGVVFLCFIVDVVLSAPPPGLVMKGFIPSLDRSSIYTAVSLLGANVMPHNFYLHSALVKNRNHGDRSIQALCHLNLIDITLALGVALLINLAVLVVSASTFHSASVSVKTLQEAHDLMEVLLSNRVAPVVFGLALLFASQLSTFTGTISGQVVLQGFLNQEMSPWLHRLLTRTIAILPAVGLQLVYGDEGAYRMLVIAQVVLAIQLPFTLVPLIKSTSEKRLMGPFTNSPFVQLLSWASTLLIFLANLMLLMSAILPSEHGLLESAFLSPHTFWMSASVPENLILMNLSLLIGSCFAVALLVWMLITPVSIRPLTSILPQYIESTPSQKRIDTDISERENQQEEILREVVFSSNSNEQSRVAVVPFGCQLGAQSDGKGLGKANRKAFAFILESFWAQYYDSYGHSCPNQEKDDLQLGLENCLIALYHLEKPHELFSPRNEEFWQEVNKLISSLLHEALQEDKIQITYPWRCLQCGSIVMDFSKLTSSQPLVDNKSLFLFGLWSLEKLIHFCALEPRPELWGRYGFVLNRLQWLLDFIPCQLNHTMLTRDMLLNLFALLETNLNTRKGKKGSVPASTAYPKGKEVIFSIIKRYRRMLVHPPTTSNPSTSAPLIILSPTLLGHVFFTLLN